MATKKETVRDELLTEVQEQNTLLVKMVNDLKTEVQGGKREVAVNKLEEQLKLLYDPFDVQNPYRILENLPSDSAMPDGQVLSWKSPRYRAVRGWRGWIPLQYGDQYAGENGEKLAGFIPDPPMRMIGPDHVDSYVRRGDVILCRLDKRIFDSRQLRRELKSALARGKVANESTLHVAPGMKIIGKGLQPDPTAKVGSLKPKDAFQKFNPSTGEGVHRTELLED